jgi:hypothetical protein
MGERASGVSVCHMLGQHVDESWESEKMTMHFGAQIAPGKGG